MRPFTIAGSIAAGLIALWAAILPLTAQPAATHATATPPAMSRALFLCRGRNGLDQACVRALAQALALGAKTDASTHVNERQCRVDKQLFANLKRHD